MPYVFGVDGGGTNSRAILATDKGQVVSICKSPGVNYHDVGASKVLNTINRLFHESLENARARREECLGTCLGLAGVGRPQDHEILKPLFDEQFGSENYLLMSDAEIALVSGTLSEFGIIATAGTGSMIFGRNEEGHSGRVGGYGPVISDEGSGYQLSVHALRELVRVHDGFTHSTQLIKPVLEFLKLKHMDELIQWVNSPKATRDKIAALAPLVVKAANEDDPLADQVLNQQADQLVLGIELLHKKLKFSERVDVVLSGGMFNEASYYRQLARRKILYLLPGANVLAPKMDPCLGAALYAYSIANVPLNDDLLDILRRTYRECMNQQTSTHIDSSSPKTESIQETKHEEETTQTVSKSKDIEQ